MTGSCGRRPEKGGCRSRRRSGPDSHGVPAAGGGGVPGAWRAALQRVRPPGPSRGPWPAERPGDLDQRFRPARADPPGPGRLTLRWGGLSQDPGSAAPRARRAGEWETGAAPAAPGRLVGPQRVRGRRKPHPHDGTIIPEAPNQRWGTDATMAWTRSDGWVWVFACIDHYSAEAWAHVAKIGDRFAALQPVYDAVIDRWASSARTSPVVWCCAMTGARNTARPTSPARWPGSVSPTAPRSWVSPRPTAVLSAGSAPSRTSACGSSCTTPSMSSARPWPGFVDRYNSSWLIQRHGHRTPKEVYQAAQSAQAA
jgi:hypothetical protein